MKTNWEKMATMASLLIAALALWNTMTSDSMENALLIERRLATIEGMLKIERK